MSLSNLAQISQALWYHLSEVEAQWFQEIQQQIEEQQHLGDALLDYYLTCSALVKSRLGSALVIDGQGSKWYADEAARVVLLNHLLEFIPADLGLETVRAAFDCGDENEKIAIIKGLVTFDPNGEAIDLALHCGRSDQSATLTAIALNNTYPLLHFKSSDYHALVLKALSMNLDIGQMVALDRFIDPVLSNMGIDAKHLKPTDKQLFLNNHWASIAAAV
jgi:hypothetical protein